MIWDQLGKFKSKATSLAQNFKEINQQLTPAEEQQKISESQIQIYKKLAEQKQQQIDQLAKENFDLQLKLQVVERKNEIFTLSKSLTEKLNDFFASNSQSFCQLSNDSYILNLIDQDLDLDEHSKGQLKQVKLNSQQQTMIQLKQDFLTHISNLNDENLKLLQEEVAFKNDQMQKLQNNLQKLSCDYIKFESESQEKTQAMEEKVKNLQKQLLDQEELLNKSKEEQIQLMKQQDHNLQALQSETETELKKKDGFLKQLQSEKSELSENFKKNQFKIDLENIEALRKVLNQYNLDLSKEMFNINLTEYLIEFNRRVNLQKNFDSFTKEVQQFLTKIKQIFLETQKKQFQNSVIMSEKEDSIKALQSSLIELQKDKENCQKQQKESSQIIKNLSQELQNQDDEQQRLKSSLKQADSQYSILQQEVSQLHKKIDQITDTKTASQTEIRKLQETITQKNEKILNLESMNHSLQQINDDQLFQKEQEFKRFSAEMKKQAREMQRMEFLEKSLSSLQKEFEALQEKNSHISRQLSMNEKVTPELNSQVERLQAENDELTKRIKLDNKSKGTQIDKALIKNFLISLYKNDNYQVKVQILETLANTLDFEQTEKSQIGLLKYQEKTIYQPQQASILQKNSTEKNQQSSLENKLISFLTDETEEMKEQGGKEEQNKGLGSKLFGFWK